MPVNILMLTAKRISAFMTFAPRLGGFLAWVGSGMMIEWFCYRFLR
jgi:hypothetical protein